MRALVIEQFGVLPEVREVAEPSCPPDGVVVRVGATGVCRSDWHAWQGHDDGVTLPHVPGHELAGTVVEVGPDVHAWTVGDLVTVPFVMACGTCATCRGGDQQVCPHQTQPGFTQWGSFAELVALDHADTNLVRVPDGMTPVAAAALGCRFATAYRAVTVHAAVRAGHEVVVLGCGGVGLSAVMVAVAAGARVVAVDPSPAARAAARAAGAHVTIAPGDDNPERLAERLVEATGGGAHATLDALGSAGTALTGVLALRRRGRHVQVGLLLGDDARTALPMDRVLAWELSVHGSHGMAAHEYPAMLAAIARGRLVPSTLVGRTIGLGDAPAALASLPSAATAGMTVVVP
ncbi:alcohol dehydrogenase catalytic domain-containing protein [Cellulomonas dongxiuzhuiae]|uniref:Alcohol dehydrogenase catalytic domain-containing protein n=1 Tax=Cellulomonas dongxiuzhuiae TaxID=2819979 RepID=A0ABX8GJK0_9CELL|nr:alcohol dehydrogenase catalytic domain-containing protein [Cellulomonas dongxiuzhuiae]MBO3094376.1 alcohol dehydrogenase catalytic domain-containing protein [Cellulomonas dongxiuzhuiae]QWC15409.1 alcohol dehydrogenase catalytic domain-containing protein [Cellulomonas dongxiuzhuiae]